MEETVKIFKKVRSILVILQVICPQHTINIIDFGTSLLPFRCYIKFYNVLKHLVLFKPV